MALTPPPAKPPRRNDESDSSSSLEMSSMPPAKPPRRFSVYKNHRDDSDLVQQTDTIVKKVLSLVDSFGVLPHDDHDMTVLRERPVDPRESLARRRPDNSIETNPTTDHLSLTKSNHQRDNSLGLPPSLVSTIDQTQSDDRVDVMASKINQYASDLSRTILHRVVDDDDDELLVSQRNTTARTPSTDTPPKAPAEFHAHISKTTTYRDNTPSVPPSKVTTHISPAPAPSRPLMFVSLDSETRTHKTIAPLLNITTRGSTPLVTTSVRVISSPPTIVASTTTVTTSDDDLNSSSTLISSTSSHSKRSVLLQPSHKQDSLDSADLNTSDPFGFVPENAGSSTPARSSRSDYDNLRGSYGSLNDDHHQLSRMQAPSLPSLSESTSTLYESLDRCPSSPTSRSYVSAVSTFNTSRSTTPSRPINSDPSEDDDDDDLLDSFDLERASQGREHRISRVTPPGMTSPRSPPPTRSACANHDASPIIRSLACACLFSKNNIPPDLCDIELPRLYTQAVTN